MMAILIEIIPGIAWASTFFLLLLSFVQLRIYLKKSYQRSKNLALFCFFAAVFAFEHFVVQSRLFSPSLTHSYVILSSTSLCLSLFFYMNSLSYFIAIPHWIHRLYSLSTLTLAFLAFLALPAIFFFDQFLYFDTAVSLPTGNYFVDSYTMRIGKPNAYVTNVLSMSGVIVVLGALYMLRVVWKTTKDTYFILGLTFSIFASIRENFMLPFTFEYFVPVIFLSNLFEAFRMNSLSYREYRREQERDQEKPAPALEIEKYQNSNLTEERLAQLAQTVVDVLSEQKLFLNPNLTAEDLARKVGIPSYQLSQVINIGLQTSFFELINRYRIDEVKRRLKDQQFQEETIINIAYASGYNSKSAFNTAFKKLTGMTPSVYRKTHEFDSPNNEI